MVVGPDDGCGGRLRSAGVPWCVWVQAQESGGHASAGGRLGAESAAGGGGTRKGSPADAQPAKQACPGESASGGMWALATLVRADAGRAQAPGAAVRRAPLDAKRGVFGWAGGCCAGAGSQADLQSKVPTHAVCIRVGRGAPPDAATHGGGRAGPKGGVREGASKGRSRGKGMVAHPEARPAGGRPQGFPSGILEACKRETHGARPARGARRGTPRGARRAAPRARRA